MRDCVNLDGWCGCAGWKAGWRFMARHADMVFCFSCGARLNKAEDKPYGTCEKTLCRKKATWDVKATDGRGAVRKAQGRKGPDAGDEEGEVSANRKRKWTVRVDGEETTFTRDDVRRYFSGGHGGSLSSFGTVQGDWRMIERIAEDARAYFGM